MKLHVLSVVPSPYQRDLFRALAAHPGVEIRVSYLEAAAPDSPWPQAELEPWEKVLRGTTLGRGRVRCHLNWGLPDLEEADIVILNASLTDWTTQDVMRRLTRRQIPWIFWGEYLRPHEGFKGVVQAQLARPLREASAVVSIGCRAQADFRQRLPGLRVEELPYHCDISAFLEIDREVPRDRETITFLFCGQMIHRKGIDLLLAAFARVHASHPQARLILAGRAAALDCLLAPLAATCRKAIDYCGFVPPGQLPELFARADIFVLPSRHDGWGVVVNQALAAGMPVIATDAVGAARDLITSGREGLVIAPDDGPALTDAMRSLLQDPIQRDRQSRAARARASALEPRRGAQRWVDLLGQIIAESGPFLAS